MDTKVKEVVKGIIKNSFGEYIDYDWNGSDFSERVSDESGINLVEKDKTLKFDEDLYNKFVEHLTEHICSGLEIDE